MATVGIVLVSHSPKLAAGLAELLAQIGSEEVLVEVAAGSPSGGLGTDPARVRAAIAKAGTADGVVIIPDLGSSVLTVRALFDEAGEAGADGKVLVDAPFVEGAVAAAVAAASGASLEEVADAARAARDVPKL